MHDLKMTDWKMTDKLLTNPEVQAYAQSNRRRPWVTIKVYLGMHILQAFSNVCLYSCPAWSWQDVNWHIMRAERLILFLFGPQWYLWNGCSGSPQICVQLNNESLRWWWLAKSTILQFCLADVSCTHLGHCSPCWTLPLGWSRQRTSTRQPHSLYFANSH